MKKRNKKSSIFHRRFDFSYPLVTHGRGIYLYNESGKKYIDAVGGVLVANLGHGVKEIAEEIKKLAERVSYLHAALGKDGYNFAKEFTLERFEKE